jgi:predicted GNAT family N-acyltransferase
MNAPVGRLAVGSGTCGAGSPYHVAVARTLEDLMQVIAVRTLVYIGEQSCPYDEEYDGNDFAGATHLILRCGVEPVGVARLRWFGGFCKLERLAIRPEHRGVSRLQMLAKAAIGLAERKGYRTLIGHADPRIVPFWRRCFGAREREGRAGVDCSDHSYVELEIPLNPPTDALSIDSDPMVLLRPEGAWDRPGVLDRSLDRARWAQPAAEPAA